MAKSVVVFVHGIGDHDEGWIAEAQERLVKDAATYPHAFPKPLVEYVDFEEVSYDKVFVEVVKDWQELSTKLLNAGFPGTAELDDADFASIGNAVIDYGNGISALTQPDRFLSTHALDVVLYGGFQLVKTVVDYCVAARLAEIVANAYAAATPGEIPRIVLVAHSLGTAVAHNAVQLLGTKDWLKDLPPTEAAGNVTDASLEPVRAMAPKSAENLDLSNPFDPKLTGLAWLSGIVMIANTSPLGVLSKPGPGENSSIVRPKFSGGSRGIVSDSYINVQHTYDPVCKLALFSTNTWAKSHAYGYAEDVTVKHIYQKNIHDLSHYLSHPSVHSRIFYLLKPDLFGESSIAAADSRVGDNSPGGFPEIGPDIANALKEKLEKKLTELGNNAGGAPNPTVKRISAIFDKLKTVLEGLS